MITAYFFDKTLTRQGVLPVLGGQLVMRHNHLSTGVLEIDGSSKLWGSFQLEGGHVLIMDGQVHLMSGKLTGMEVVKEQGVTDVTLKFTCHLIYLHRMITLPSPERAVTSQTVRPYYTGRGAAETMIADMVSSHIGQTARAENKTILTVDPTQGRGKTVSVNSRFKNLLEDVQELAGAGGTSFHTRIDYEAGRVVFEQYLGKDLSRVIRLREDDGTLERYSYSLESPTATRVLVAGQGEGTARTLRLVTGNPNDWDEKGLVFQDRRDTDSVGELDQAGAETLTDHQQKHSISISTTEPGYAVFGLDYTLGDKISVQLTDGATIIDTLQRVELSWGETGKTYEISVGPYFEEPDSMQALNIIRQLRSDIRGVQTQ